MVDRMRGPNRGGGISVVQQKGAVMTNRHEVEARVGGASRPAWKVGRVAAELDCDPATVRKRVRDGSLEAYRLGKRALRIYADSVVRYRQDGAVGRQAHAQAPSQAAPPHFDARHNAAVARLRKLGVL
jgi:hypothetical protein